MRRPTLMPKKCSVNIKINYNVKEIGSLATSFLTNLWEQDWNSRRNSHHHNLQPLVSKTTQTHHSRNSSRIFTRLSREGGGGGGVGGGGVVKGLGYTKFKIRQIRSPECQTKYSISHFLLECNKYNIERGILLAEFASLGKSLRNHTAPRHSLEWTTMGGEGR